MRKITKRIVLFLAGVLLFGILTGCETFDASAYTKAILDNSYLNESSAFVEAGIGTEEVAAVIYEQGIEAHMEEMHVSANISEELKEAYRQFYRDLYAKARYTVGEAVKIEKDRIEVTITYEKLKVFQSAFLAYEEKVNAFVLEWTQKKAEGEEIPSEEERNEQIYTVLKDCLVEQLQTASYEEPATTVIRVERIEEVWTPNSEDLLNLEYVLFDFDGLYAK